MANITVKFDTNDQASITDARDFIDSLLPHEEPAPAAPAQSEADAAPVETPADVPAAPTDAAAEAAPVA